MNAAEYKAHVEECLCGRLRQLKGEPAKNVGWARLVCKTSRNSHMKVWQELPPRAAVKALIALFELLLGEMKTLQDRGVDVKEVNDNITVRLNSCQNYLDGKPPLLPKKPAIEEERKLVESLTQLLKDGGAPWPPPDDEGQAVAAGDKQGGEVL